MISDAYITAWSSTAPWATRTQIEQDLLLGRLICEIANDAFLGSELVFRGGTCLHKLLLPVPRRYSEDLDYVRITASGIGTINNALRVLGERLGFEVETRLGSQPKVILKATSAEGLRMKIKVEMNTHERSPAEPHIQHPFSVESAYWTGSALVRTFTPRELVATKIRALYQRKKGRDLFDLWLALTELGLTGDDLLAVFPPYRPAGLTAITAETNLRQKLDDQQFRTDLNVLVRSWPIGYDIDTAAELIIVEILRRL